VAPLINYQESSDEEYPHSSEVGSNTRKLGQSSAFKLLMIHLSPTPMQKRCAALNSNMWLSNAEAVTRIFRIKANFIKANLVETESRWVYLKKFDENTIKYRQDSYVKGFSAGVRKGHMLKTFQSGITGNHTLSAYSRAKKMKNSSYGR
jgi:hypothetical protein